MVLICLNSASRCAVCIASLLLLFMPQQLATQRTANWDAKLQRSIGCARSSCTLAVAVAVAVMIVAVAIAGGIAMTSHYVLLWLLYSKLAP
jgi:hypothetical protein